MGGDNLIVKTNDISVSLKSPYTIKIEAFLTWEPLRHEDFTFEVKITNPCPDVIVSSDTPIKVFNTT